MLYMPQVYYLALAIRRLGRLLGALWDSLVALTPT